MFRIIAALALACVLSACQTAANPTAWSQIAAGVGAIVGETKIDPQIERISAKLARYCDEVQIAALAVDLFAPEKVQRAAQDARLVVATFCAAPPKNVGTALIALGDAYAAIAVAKRS